MDPRRLGASHVKPEIICAGLGHFQGLVINGLINGLCTGAAGTRLNSAELYCIVFDPGRQECRSTVTRPFIFNHLPGWGAIAMPSERLHNS